MDVLELLSPVSARRDSNKAISLASLKLLEEYGCRHGQSGAKNNVSKSCNQTSVGKDSQEHSACLGTQAS